jgi:hypothetical protein
MNLMNTFNKLDSHTLEVLAKSASSMMLATIAAVFNGLLPRVAIGR